MSAWKKSLYQVMERALFGLITHSSPVSVTNCLHRNQKNQLGGKLWGCLQNVKKSYCLKTDSNRIAKNGKGNLFTQVAPQSSGELVYTCTCIPDRIGI